MTELMGKARWECQLSTAPLWPLSRLPTPPWLCSPQHGERGLTRRLVDLISNESLLGPPWPPSFFYCVRHGTMLQDSSVKEQMATATPWRAPGQTWLLKDEASSARLRQAPPRKNTDFASFWAKCTLVPTRHSVVITLLLGQRKLHKRKPNLNLDMTRCSVLRWKLSIDICGSESPCAICARIITIYPLNQCGAANCLFRFRIHVPAFSILRHSMLPFHQLVNCWSHTVRWPS